MSTILEAHRQWAVRPADQRFETLEALQAAVHNRRLRSRSVDAELSSISAKVENDTLVFNRGMKSVEPTHWSFNQLCGWIKTPAAYLRDGLSPELAADCLNYGLQKHKDLGFLKFMAISEEEKPVNTLQAVTSTSYGRIWDADVVAAVQRVVERSGGRFYNPKAYVNNGQGFSGISGATAPSGLYASDRDVFMFMIDGGSLLDVGPRAKINRGFICWNSEVGDKTFGLTTFLFNQCCGNHIIMGATDVNKFVVRHCKNGPYRFDSEAAPALLNYCNASAKPVEDTIRKASDCKLGDNDDAVREEVGKRGKFTKTELSEMVSFARAEEGECRTLWHAVQGLTAYARGYDYVDARVDLETRAGKLLEAVSNN